MYVSLGKEVQKITSLTGCMDEQLSDFLRYDLVKEVRLIAIPAGSLKMIIPGPNYCYRNAFRNNCTFTFIPSLKQGEIKPELEQLF